MPNTATSEASQLSPEWTQWLAENQAIGVPIVTLVQSMVDNGIDPQVAMSSARVKHLHIVPPQPEADRVSAQLLAKLESILAVNRQQEKLAPHFGHIERRSHLSKQEFLDQYYSTSTPVIITGMMNDWEALNKWSPEYLKTHYGDENVEIQTNRSTDDHYEINANYHKQTIALKDYVDMVVGGGETNDYYLVAGNQNLERDRLKGLLDDIHFPDFFDTALIQQRVFFWFGPGGTVTPLHHDHVNVMMAQVVGRKRWRLVSPNHTPLLYNRIGVYSQVDLENIDYEKFPLFKDVTVLETIVEPGELIFVPVGWWHQVVGLDVSLSLSLTNFAFPNQYDYQNPNIQSVAPPQKPNESIVRLKRSSTMVSDSGTAKQSAPRLNFSSLFRSQPLTYDEVKSNQADGYLIDQIIQDELLIISFGFVSWDGPPGFDFFGRTQKLAGLAQKPMNRILVRDFSNSWYQRGVVGLGDSIDEVSDRLKKIIQHIAPSRIVTIGQSMGAYAAIMFGHLLGADQVLAFGTLSFLDVQRAEQMGDRRWLSVMQGLEADRPDQPYFDLVELGKQSAHKPKIELFYGKQPDPDTPPGQVNLDHIHAQNLASLPHCTLHPYEDSGHAIVKYLIDHQLIDQVLLRSLGLNVE